MKNLHDPACVAEIRTRLGQLSADSNPRWGKMNVAQAVAHLCVGIESALGDVRPPRLFIGRVIGGLAKMVALGKDGPIGKNAPTAPSFRITDERDLEHERDRLLALINRFARGAAACTSHPHVFFGPMTPDEWAVLQYKHLDHHLSQFGV